MSRVTESVLAQDLKQLIEYNPDVSCSLRLREKILEFDDDAIVRCKRRLSPIRIISVEEITEDAMASKLRKIILKKG